MIIFIKVMWHSTPTLYQFIEHIKYFYARWLAIRLYSAHWLILEIEKTEVFLRRNVDEE
jgi:hypothetical protein